MKVFKYLGAKQAEIADVPAPEIGAGEVLVRTKACGICATDVKTYLRGHPLIPPGTVLGHEASGIIVTSRAAGWQPGDRVVAAPYIACGECLDCRRGHHSLCGSQWEASIEPGGFAEFMRVPARIVERAMYRLPDALDFRSATLAEPLACCVHGLEAMGARRAVGATSRAAGDRSPLLIVGDGPMGLMQAMLGRAWGLSPVVLAGMTPERLAVAARHADAVIDTRTAVLHDAVMALTGGQGADYVMVSVGQAEVAEQALALARRGGAVNLFAGLPSSARITVDPRRIHYDEVTLLGTFGFGPDHFRQAFEALAAGTLDLSEIITHAVSLEGLEAALLEAGSYRGIKGVLEFA